MARPWRVQYPGAVYHVMARGNDRREIFHDRSDREDFLALVGRARARFRLEVFAFCLMDNHYHLFLRTLEPNLAAAMHWLNGTYTNRFNRRRSRSGHLLQGRYKAVVVGDDSHWITLSSYIHLNPVRAGLAADPGQYEWSSFRDYTRARPRFEWLATGPLLRLFGRRGDEAARRRKYRRHVVRLAGRPPAFWEELRSAVFLGTREQWEALKRDHPPAGRDDTAVEFNLRPGRAADFEEELERVARVFDVNPDEVRAGRRRGRVRPALYYHLVEQCGLAGARVAELAGVSEMAVSLGRKRVRERLAEDEALWDKIRRLA